MAYYSQSHTGYNHQNPAYNGTSEKYQMQQTGVNMPATVTVERQDSKESWSWCSSGWSIFTVFCCGIGSFCGFFGLLCSVWSYVDHKSQDYDRARYKRRWSWGCTIFGLIFGIAVIAAIIVVAVVLKDELCDQKIDGFEDWCDN